ncbi:hypothetical protein [Clostridium paraputrificum]|uniref:hypothetical protein n=1 Tax=Clostridium paraputrificum TaxID=29363 RepID=UPI0034A3219C
MTAEIGILNRQGVALAADSAVTISTSGKQKVLNSANKLFNLIKGYPVGLMVYGDGDFLGIPWDIIIDDYRKNFQRDSEFDTLYEYCESFINSISNPKFYSLNSYIQKTYNNLHDIMNIIIEEVKNSLTLKYPNREISQDEARSEFIDYVKRYNKRLGELEYAKGFVKDDYDYLINDDINNKIVQEYLESNVVFSVNEQVVDEMRSLNALIQCKKYFDNYSGIVIAGYGYNEFFPRLYEFKVFGIVNGKLKYDLNSQEKISASILDKEKVAAVIPFAQQEMVQTILKGMDPELYNLIIKNLEVLIDEIHDSAKEIFNCGGCTNVNNNIEALRESAFNNVVEMMKFVNEKSTETYTRPVLSMVASLPKDELASMAETLVNLTSFKRRITMDAETVGGPIDVAVISKSEGFVWMKRKLYFPSELNKQYYFKDYYKGGIKNDFNATNEDK